MKSTPLYLVLSLAFSQAVAAKPPRIEPPKGIGAGIVMGVPTGISLGYRTESKSYFDAAVAWSVTQDSLHLHFDSLFELTQIVDPNAPQYQFPLYTGLGVRIQVSPSGSQAIYSVLGIRAPIGITFLPQVAPFEVFAEFAPVLSIYPDTRINFDFAIGARYYFSEASR
jgi:hypothetical protein